MKRNLLLLTAAALIAAMITTTTSAQQCGGPVPLLSVYTTIDKNTDLGLGTEFGSLSEDSHWGYFAGVVMSIKKPETVQREKEAARPGETIYKHDLTVYIKGSYRLYRTERSSFHAVTSVELNAMSKLDVKSGIRILLPVSDKVALTAEPLYSVRNRDVTGRVGLIIGF